MDIHYYGAQVWALDRLKAGDRVNSGRYGDGTVLRILDTDRIEVQFDSADAPVSRNRLGLTVLP